MKGKDIAIIILSVISIVELIIIFSLTHTETPKEPIYTEPKWENIKTN